MWRDMGHLTNLSEVKRGKQKGKRKKKKKTGEEDREERERGERDSTFSLRSMELGWSSRVGLRFKVGVRGEDYVWISETPSFIKVRTRGLGSRRLRVREVFAELPRVVAHAPRGRETSYLGLFFI